jgi:hypothetical protein
LSTNCEDACSFNYGQYTYWQQSSFGEINNAKYRDQGNCSTSTCDFNGGFSFAQYYQEDNSCKILEYSCGGVGFTFGSCFGGLYSDVNLKQGIETIKDSLSKLMKLDAVEYDWNDKLNPNMYQYFVNQQRLHTIGLIAQNVRLYFPEVVGMNDEGFYYIDYQKLNAVLVEGIKSLQEEIDDIDVELNEIELKLN